MTVVVKLTFIVFLVLTTFLAKLSVGLPVRSFVLVGLTGFLGLFFTDHFRKCLRLQRGTLILLMAFGVLGFILTLVSGSPSAVALESFNQFIVQIALTFICVYVVTSILGPMFVLRVFLACTFFTATFALLQYFAVDPAWKARLLIADFQGEPHVLKALVARKDRAIGLSTTTMNLAYQIVAALVIVYALGKARLISGGMFNILAAILLVGAVACEVRSLLIGMIAAIVVYNVRENRVPLSVIALVGMGFAMIGSASLGEESRITSADDGSAVARYVLLRYGTLLFYDNLFGFGWGFDSRQYFWMFWSQLMDFENASAVASYGLHNYYLNFAVDYGIIGLMLVAFTALVSRAKFLRLCVVFLPYWINSFFHNGGPFNAEVFFWFALAIYMYLQDRNCFEREVASYSPPRFGAPLPHGVIVAGRPAN